MSGIKNIKRLLERLFWIAVGMSLVFPLRVQANNRLTVDYEKIAYFESPENVLYRPTDEVVEKLAEEYEVAQARQKIESQNYGGNCVTFAKNFLGIYGTWGNGGRNLDLNSGPELRAVIVFTYTHVAIELTAPDANGNFTIIESNYIATNKIGKRILNINDPTIRGYHLFNN